MAWTSLTARNAGDAILASDQQAWVNNLNALRGDYMAARRTAGNITLNSNGAWADVNTGLDLTLAAAAGDLVEFTVSALLANAAVEVYFDVVTVVSGSPVNSFARDTSPANPPTSYGIPGWICNGTDQTQLQGSAYRTLVSGDISSGTVVLRLRYASGSATNRTMEAGTATPLLVWARNHGPVEV